MPSSSQYITFSAPGIGTVKALMQEVPPKELEGDPIWNTVQRPNRPSLTLWVGRNPIQISIPVIFAGDGASIEQDINTLDRMRRSPSESVQPPAVKVSGAVPRRDITNWVIMSIVYGDNVQYMIERGVPVRTMQDVTVTLLERIDESRVANAKILPHHAFHVVKSGETLQSISKTEYGDVSHVAAIRKANNLTDSRKPKVGARLRMP